MTRRALVTGCSRGIGFGVTRMLLRDGWHVLGVSRTFPRSMLETDMERFGWLKLDVGQGRSRWQLADYLGDHPLDAVVHCAAVQGPRGLLHETGTGDWLETVNVNLSGTYRVLRATLPLLLKSEDGRALLFSGGGAFDPRPEFTAYAASKAGVVALMEGLADELRDTSVTVNCVAPGYVPSGMPGTWASDKSDEALETAVACVRHLLSPATRGLSGKTVAAQWDDWRSINQATIVSVNASAQGTRHRHPIQRVQEMTRATLHSAAAVGV
jgi:NAD(P)-dependent dehydrogenase (short-subunit alcohol dehydrogenase family)